MADETPPCHSRLARGDVPLTALDSDHIDYAFLTAARMFFNSFAGCEPTAWLGPILASDAYFQGDNGAEIMRRVLAVVHEMRSSRRSTFRFSNPRCKGCSAIVTQDELYLMQMLQQARSGDTGPAATSAMLLCEGHDTTRLLMAVRDLATIVPARKRVSPTSTADQDTQVH